MPYKADFFSKYITNSKSKIYLNMLKLCEKAAKSNVNIMLVGASGSGKEVTARYIHHMSHRNHMPLVTINCASYLESLLESELFGHVKGAYTGATDTKIGIIETSNLGTLFLDEVGDLSLQTQIKLLRTLETKKIAKVGCTEEIAIDFRLITATNIDIGDAVLANRIREDFAYRISTIVIRVPSLRERMEDFEDLLQFMLKKSQIENNIEITGIDPQVKKFLYSYNYPGNLRELKNITDRMVVLSENGIITEEGIPIVHSLGKKSMAEDDRIIPLREFRDEREKEYLIKTLDHFYNSIPDASKALEISDRQLFNKIKKYNLKGNQ